MSPSTVRSRITHFTHCLLCRGQVLHPPLKTHQHRKKEAERAIREISDGTQAAALNANQSRGAPAALLPPLHAAGIAASLTGFPMSLVDQRQQEGICLGTDTLFTARPRLVDAHLLAASCLPDLPLTSYCSTADFLETSS